MYRIEDKTFNTIPFTKPNFNTFFHQKDDFIIFTCNNSIVTYIVKEVQKERYS
ncbi:hypothetical protein REY75_05270 [Bacillus sp. MHSD_37]|uniref:hypothetical protein n=1 Tax=Bacillus sp. MHSD_37 TaxID=3073272 RepID=UPI002853469F|nr:hypothetical protein [Bacillus sp. MHSD_37]MDR4977978.1 hypothetical protein [Bacillus sp. MHSD_37]